MKKEQKMTKKIKRMDAEERKKQILDCATQLFGKNGYHQIQISDIQKTANVARGTIYRYYKNKDDIFGAILKNLYADWKKVLSDLPAPDSEEYKSGKKFFIYQVRNTLKFFIDNPDYCSILLNIGLGVNTIFDKILRRLDKEMVAFIANYIRTGIKLGRIKPDIDMEMVSNIIGGSMMRLIYYYGLLQKNKPQYDLDLLTERFVDYMLFGTFLNKE